jgi:tRNA threonylcarbamoyladenosine biosynthesis protein TsaB
MLLAIDTATHIASLALYDERGVLGEATWRTRENHTSSLMPELVQLMGLIGAQIADLRAIGVVTGPGSFTGLRIGLSVAKGLAFSLNLPLIGVPTLDVSASIYSGGSDIPVCAVIQAGRERYGIALYENENGAQRRVSEYMFGTANEIADQLQHVWNGTALYVIGEVNAPLRTVFQTRFGGAIVWAGEALNVRRAGVLAELAWKRWQVGAVDDVQALAPYYIPTTSLA